MFASGKEKFFIHPLIEIFMKLKWKKTWFLYWIYLVLLGSFFLALTGYSIIHYGSLYKGYRFDYGDERSGWWLVWNDNWSLYAHKENWIELYEYFYNSTYDMLSTLQVFSSNYACNQLPDDAVGNPETDFHVSPIEKTL